MQEIDDGRLNIYVSNNGVVDPHEQAASASIDLVLKDDTTEIRPDRVRFSSSNVFMKLSSLEHGSGVLLFIS